MSDGMPDLNDEDRDRHGLPVIWTVMTNHLEDIAMWVDHTRISALYGDREGVIYHWDRTRDAFERARTVRNKAVDLTEGFRERNHAPLKTNDLAARGGDA